MSFDWAFRGEWREYQAAILADVGEHLFDRRVHVVAAPGSGKTILGIELVRRLGHRTLVLTPTVVIRDQWLDRMRSMFLETSVDIASVASSEIDRAAPVTILTYQKLHSLSQAERQGELDQLVAHLAGNGPATLVLDEAHHLRREWWRVIEQVRTRLGDPFVVALTATPPYDVDPAEWRRYEALCGPIDEEIPIPALVRSGDLAPHQDLIMLARPCGDEASAYARHVADMTRFLRALPADPEFKSLLSGHRWLGDPEAHVDAILERPDLFAAMLTFAHGAGLAIPAAGRSLLGVDQSEWPAMTAEWLEILISALLFDPEENDPDRRRAMQHLRGETRRLGLLEGERVRLSRDRRFYGDLASSLAKIDSISAIATVEAQSLGAALRLAILADHVRLSDLPRTADAVVRPAKLGVVPIFEALRRAAVADGRVAVLSGPLTIIPVAALAAMDEVAAARGGTLDAIRREPLVHDPAYCRLTVSGTASERLVPIVTELFRRGDIRVLVGTQALLGEGWDAPSINSLVIASSVGSFMLSNQLRGRALRLDPACPGKVANIWHLATAVDGWDGLEGWDRIGPDVAMLARRFAAFEGLSFDGSVIESGLARASLPTVAGDPSVDGFNRQSIETARGRERVAERWRSALLGHSARPRMRRQLRSRRRTALLLMGDTIENALLAAVGGGMLSAAQAMRHVSAGANLFTLLLLFGGASIAYALPKLVKMGWLFLRHGTPERSLEQTARALIEALDYAGLLHTAGSDLAIESDRGGDGRARLTMTGGTRHDERLVLGGLVEILSPIGNPRFLLRRRSRFLRWRQADWHAVPQSLGQRRDWAESFAARWRGRVGSANLIETRSLAGRKLLLRARIQSLSGSFGGPPDERMIWS